MKLRQSLCFFLILFSVSGCIEFSPRPNAGVAGEIIGCVEMETELLCATRYPLNTEITDAEKGDYLCTIADIESVYDGDTITDAQILVSQIDLSAVERLGEVFPEIVLKADGIYVVDSIRITGIDTPEIRPSTKKSDGTPRSERSRENEKKAALAARDAVRKLIADNNLLFSISDVGHDKFGRVLAQVYAGDTNIAEYLIENGHAVRYDGGTRQELDWDTLDQGLVF